MNDYLVIYQVETEIRARNREEAERRAEEMADKLRVLPPPIHPSKRRWWPEIVEVAEITVAQGE